jgi:CHAD domain-containing protein
VRLVRSELGETYQQENTWFRDAGRKLSRVRDAEAMIETFDKLHEVFQDQLQEGIVRTVRETLVQRRQQIADEEVDLDRRALEMAQELANAKQRIQSWPLKSQDFATIDPNLQKTYARGKTAIASAYRNPTSENFHEWRKRVKYHWYHNRLLEKVWPAMMKGYRQSLKELSDLLGDDHDLVVLRETLLAEPDNFGAKRDIQALLGLIDRRQDELRVRAETLGWRIFAEKPKDLSRRIGQYWKAWQVEVRRSAVLTKTRVS